MNDFSQIDGDSDLRDEMTIGPEEPNDSPYGEGDAEDTPADAYGERSQDEDCGWPGGDSDCDDLVDFNSNEGNDYQNE